MMVGMERIVVGVDGSPNSRAALLFAVEEAQRRGARVDAVMAWHRPYTSGGDVWLPTMTYDVEAVEQGYRVHLEKVIASVNPPESVVVEPVLIEGTGAHSLMSAAEGAALLIVGKRGHGGFLGLLLGSVSHQVAAHAPCPVVIVPAP